jgi:hypothetical protein
MFASDYVITLDEMPNLKTYSTAYEPISNDHKFQVYPTIFDDQITIRTFGTNQLISIYNQLGICVTQVKSENNFTVIPTSSYPSGMYLIKKEGTKALKIFKQ